MQRNVAALSVRSTSAGTPSWLAARSAASSDARASRKGASQAAFRARSCLINGLLRRPSALKAHPHLLLQILRSRPNLNSSFIIFFHQPPDGLLDLPSLQRTLQQDPNLPRVLHVPPAGELVSEEGLREHRHPLTLSSVEFHPLCVQNAATAGCASTSCCGAHSTTLPLPSAAAWNPSGSSTGSSPPASATRPRRTTHRNGRPLPARPHAISASSARVTLATLPKLTYSTDPGAWVSSQPMQLRSALSRLVVSPAPAAEEEEAVASLWSGPTAKAGMPLGASSSRMVSSSWGSRASKVLRIAPEELVVVPVARSRILCPISLLGSLLGSNRSLTRSGGSSSTGARRLDSIIGIPSLIPSSVEFHPPWVQNPPTAGWASTSRCGAHRITMPLPSTASSNPSGSRALSLSESPPTSCLGRTTHRKGWPLSARPQASSKNSSASMDAKLPKLTYSTDPGRWVSSHLMQLLLPELLEESLWRGPAASTTGRSASSSRILCISAGSSSSNVLMTTPEQFLTVSVPRANTLRTISWSQCFEKIRSFTRRGGSSGTGL
ncbi:LOW QUALITY PROTEIN: hypothetical protein U9M48_012273 [Paspalum notatum var. saurae]|uniref:Uncharacterized protein n=1 Tax=Paspalum notatum var. saurae TaxID=547442 RepID=A0AAQ3SX86_PASNO